MSKDKIRHDLRVLRVNVRSVRNRDVELLSRCFKYTRAPKVHVYRSQMHLNERATTHIVEWLKYELDAFVVQPDTKTDAAMYEDTLDVIIVPVLGFDTHGNRIGMGGGWYDKFLAMHPNALKVGLAYDECELQKIEPEPHDVRLDYIITPTRLIDTHQLQ